MKQYILRLDDACPRYDLNKWIKIEKILDKYNIKPLVGIIPDCQDPELLVYPEDSGFWERAEKWKKKGWTIALHGYNHVYRTKNGGINPVNPRSEFAGIPYKQQYEFIRKGIKILNDHDISPKVFFAPSHTFDLNTIKALKENGIDIISDGIADKPFFDKGISFVPVQSGRVRKLPFSVITFCYHPNTMKDENFCLLENFLKDNKQNFVSFPEKEVHRNPTFYDKLLRFLYFARRK